MPWNANIVDSEILAVHAALVPSGSQGEVVLFGGDEHWTDQQESAGGGKFKKTRIYDVQTHSIVGVVPPSPESDVFCSHHAFAADGRLLIGGGTQKWPESGDAHQHGLDFLGHRRCWLYNARARSWVEAASYNKNPDQPDEEHSGGRWYPGLITLANGDVLSVFGHLDQQDFRHRNTIPERYSLAANTWTLLPKEMAYPIEPVNGVRYLFFARAFQLPDGKLFFATPMPVDYDTAPSGDGTYFSTRYDPGTGTYEGHKIPEPGQGGYLDWSRTAVLLPLLPTEDYRPRVLFAGDTTAIKIDLDPGIATPSWQSTAARVPAIAGRTRTYSYCVTLPTGQVCLIGGVNVVNPEDAVLEVEVYDPGIDWASGTYANPDSWSLKEAGSFVRNYHCTALLLPNGKVWVAGGDHNASSGDPNVVGVKKIELYEPDYIAVANRIQIVSAPSVLSWGESFDVQLDQPATQAQRVALVRNGSATHSTNNDQRYVGLTINARNGNTLSLSAPPSGNVAPPGYYMLWVLDAAGNPCVQAAFVRVARLACEVITDLDTYSVEQVQSTGGGGLAVFDRALYLNFEGFIDSEVTGTPSFALTWADNATPVPASDMTLLSNGRWREIDPPPPDTTQRITYPFQVRFFNMNVFSTFTDTRQVTATFTLGNRVCSQTLELTKSPNPYMLDIDPAINNPAWLSTDVRVFKVLEGDTKFGTVTHGAGANAPYTFIKQVLDKFNSPPNDPAHQFDTILQGESASAIEWASEINGTKVYNYAVAKVRYRAVSTVAQNVKVFFRAFNVAATGLDFSAANYPNSAAGPNTVPLLSAPGGETTSVPFFLSPRVETVQGQPGATSMASQTLDPAYEARSITPTAGTEVTMYFGCWLDSNQPRKLFPITPGGSNGPWPAAACKSLQELIRGHQCLVAEVFFETDPTGMGKTPGNSDNLSQRNLAILDVDNPGAPASHRLLHTFELKPSRSFAKERTRPDELLIRWHNLPRDSEVTLHFSDLDTADILRAAAWRMNAPSFQVIDQRTIKLRVADDTWLPIPGDRVLGIPVLLDVQLPMGIVYGQRFHISVQQVDGPRRRVIGSFEIDVPVRKAELIVDDAVRQLSVLKYVIKSIPPSNRWYDIFKLYVHGMGERVDALGGDSSQVHGNPDGSGLPYVPPPPARPGLCWEGCAIAFIALLVLLAAGLFTAAPALVAAGAIGLLSIAVIANLWSRRCCHRIRCSLSHYLALGCSVASLGLLALLVLGVGGPNAHPALVVAVLATAVAIFASWVMGCQGRCCDEGDKRCR